MSASNKKKLRKEQQAATMTEKQKQAQKEAKSLKIQTTVFATIMILVVAILLGNLYVLKVDPMVDGLLRRNSHAITIGEHEISAAELTYFYVDAITAHQNSVYNAYYSTFGSYWSLMLGYDTTQPLDEQKYTGGDGRTWADYFIDEAISSARDTYALYDAAVAAGHKLSDKEQTNLDSYIATLPTYATYFGFSSVKAYLRDTYGYSATEEDYTAYYTLCALSSSYYTAYSDALEFEVEDYRAWEKGDEEDTDKFFDYTTFSLMHYTVKYNSYLGEGVKDANGTTTWTDAEKNAAREQAKADMEALIASGIKDKESFNKAIHDLAINTTDKDGNAIEESKKPNATEINRSFYPNITVHAEARKWLLEDGLTAGTVKAFPVISYTSTSEAAADKDHEHSETCGCPSTIDGYTIVLFQDRNDNDMKLVNVRHILVKFTGGTKDSNGNVTYSDTEKAVAKAEAESLLKQWKEGAATEDSFGELANKESDDQNGKVTNGGLYEDIYPGQMVTNFNDWCFDQDRKPGDTDVVETEYGYHVMYFSSYADMTYRDTMIEEDLRADTAEKWLEDLVNKAPFQIVDLKRMEYDLILD